MNAVNKAQQILTLARSREPSDRERLMLALVDLCQNAQADGAVVDPSVQALMNSVFMALVSEAERDIRRALAERLADAAWAPHDLVNMLALDEVEIARPIIAQSPVLGDRDLVSILSLAAIEHQIEVARRPCIGGPVVEAILSKAEPAVMTALADNDTADINPEGMARLVEASREIAAMRSPLVRHPKLSTDMAEQLYAWVGQSLRAAIVGRFRVDAKALDAAIAQAVSTAQKPQGRSSIIFAQDGERREMERKLAAKLKAASQLRPDYLIKALREQRLTLFIAALAELAGVKDADIERAINAGKPELLALACTAAGVDRGAFSTILALVRQLAGGRPAGGEEAGRRAMQAFSVHDPKLAATAFRSAMAAA